MQEYKSVIITNYCWHIAYKECCNLVDRKRHEFAMENSTEYRAIPKGRGFVCAYDSQLYRQVKKVGRVRYLKCTITHCDGSAKLDNGQITTAVSAVSKMQSSCGGGTAVGTSSVPRSQGGLVKDVVGMTAPETRR